jgi:hypothetical protein
VSQENVEIVRKALTDAFVWGRPDAETLRQVLDPDCVFVSNWGVEEAEHHGLDAALAAHAEMSGVWTRGGRRWNGFSMPGTIALWRSCACGRQEAAARSPSSSLGR